ncbi:saccharopine dehydrogenase NADP-binding domain-containing protein [Gordonia paraffinivorans]|uniref:saccharopine dehydrogenase NADP-binding domain-containing protein n=1 Tax=Gordonia paraffinivorans TaxID=175628 RepID=UPI00242A49E6|nr:saccharopine dehydrogenase NADP-binding domain-containing protein [Gordonia paraffinivorans]
MRFMVTGGGGEMGRAAATLLARQHPDAEILVADIDPGAGEAAATAVRAMTDAKVASVEVDITEIDDLAALLRSCDAVLNTAGPFFMFGDAVLSAAILARTAYIDICDDPEPTLELLELHGAAEAAGVPALIGMGASPGVSNLLAVRAARELDTVDGILTGWNIDAAHPEPGRGGQRKLSAALRHGLEQMSGDVPVLRDGELVRRPALERIAFEYPGLGARTGLAFGHPEAVTLHDSLPVVRSNTNIAVSGRVGELFLRGIRWGIDKGLLTPGIAGRISAAVYSALPPSPADIVKPGGTPPLFAIASGTRDGRPGTVAVALAQVPGLTMALNTTAPLVAALPALLAGRPGVHTPESLLDPDEFDRSYARLCIGDPAPEKVTVTTRSWESPEANAQALQSSLLTAFLSTGGRR